MNDEKNLKCYLICLKKSHEPIHLPHQTHVIIGRSKLLNIPDKECSRKQLQVTADCNRQFVTVKQFGANPSQIDSIDVGVNNSNRLKPGQTLHIIDSKFPHECVFHEQGTEVKKQKAAKPVESERPAKVLKTNEDDENIKDKINEEAINEQKLELLKSNTNIKAEKQHYNGHWSNGLKSAKSGESNAIYKDNKITIINDKYPKAKCHWLVMPNEDISKPSKLKPEHCDLLEHMLKKGKDISEKLGGDRPFRFGYHAIPSMSTLHMHVISQDFNSACLKTKKHWNSFTSEYFVNAEDMINELKNTGKIIEQKHLSSLLNNPLKCHVCGKPQQNMPTLKKHILSCAIR